MNNKKDEITAKKLVEIFLPKLWIVALVSILFAVIFGGYSELFQKDTFTSSGKFMVIKVPYDDDDSKTTGLNSNEVLAMQSMIANSKEIINTNDFCSTVLSSVKDGDLNMTTGQLMSAMSVTLCNAETTCYYFNVTTTNNRWSYEIAEVAGELLRQQFIDMGYAIKIVRIDSPRIASAPDSKNTTRNVVIGFAAGLILSLLCVFFISKFDVVIRSREKLENTFDVPILGVIPKPETNK